jgi:hypothetical protein
MILTWQSTQLPPTTLQVEWGTPVLVNLTKKYTGNILKYDVIHIVQNNTAPEEGLSRNHTDHEPSYGQPWLHAYNTPHILPMH